MQEAASFAAAAQSWSNVANVNFARVFSAATAHFVEQRSTLAVLGGGTLADHQVPADAYNSNVIVDVDIQTFDPLIGRYAIDANGWDNGGLTVGGDAHMTLIHEIGHGLGLDHTHNGGAGDPHIFPAVVGEQSPGTNNLNDILHSVMSYRKGPLIRDNTAIPNDNDFGNAGTPMAFDIAAIQFLYGANMTFRNGNDTYVLPDGAGAGTFWTGIWDTGGIDEITYAGNTNATIDLRPASLQNAPGGGGFASNVNGIFGGYTIAADFTNVLADVNGETGVIIENASGGGGNDTIIGNAANNTLRGNGGNDTINAGSGNDIIVGGTGNDAMTGGPGNDTYFVDSLLDTTVETGGFAGGRDTIIVNFTFTLPGSVERLNMTGTAANTNATGNSLNNVLANGAGNNLINGGAGIDLMIGGAGNDTYLVDNLFDFAQEFGGGGTDTVRSAVDYRLKPNIENLLLTGTAGSRGIGNDEANTITGNAGNNSINGWNASDILTGGAGNDFFGFNTTLGPNNIDTITDFSVADDTIILQTNAFPLLTAGGGYQSGLPARWNRGDTRCKRPDHL